MANPMNYTQKSSCPSVLSWSTLDYMRVLQWAEKPAKNYPKDLPAIWTFVHVWVQSWASWSEPNGGGLTVQMVCSNFLRSTFFFLRKRADNCCESTAKFGEENSLSLTEFYGKLGEFCFGTQIIGWEELTEFDPRSSVRAEKLTELSVWNHTLRNRIRPVSDF